MCFSLSFTLKWPITLMKTQTFGYGFGSGAFWKTLRFYCRLVKMGALKMVMKKPPFTVISGRQRFGHLWSGRQAKTYQKVCVFEWKRISADRWKQNEIASVVENISDTSFLRNGNGEWSVVGALEENKLTTGRLNFRCLLKFLTFKEWVQRGA